MARLEQLLEMLKQDPADSFLRYGVALEYAKTGNFAEAMNGFETLVAEKPEYVPAYFMAGRTQEQAGEPARAAAWYRRGIEVANRVGDKHAAGEMREALEAVEG